MMPITPSGTRTRWMREPVRALPLRQHPADRIRQRGDLLEPGGDRLQARGVEAQPVEARVA